MYYLRTSNSRFCIMYLFYIQFDIVVQYLNNLKLLNLFVFSYLFIIFAVFNNIELYE